ncbi:MAG TPA: hypothetical protein VK928_09450, partial [Longimicrobiales bacterium]|nr:hypothetical protein [Longimicrobiales bacterium]
FGGLFTATALTLIVIPVVYELIDDLGIRLRRRGEARVAATPPGPAARADVGYVTAERVGGD